MSVTRYGGAVGLLSDFSHIGNVQNNPAGSTNEGGLLIGVGTLSTLEDSQFWVAGTFPGQVQNALQPFGAQIVYPNASGVLVTGPNFPSVLTSESTSSIAGTYYWPPWQTLEMIFEFSAYDSVAQTWTDDGYIEIAVNGTILGRVSGLTLKLHQWNTVTYQIQGFVNAVYVSQVPRYCAGFGQVFTNSHSNTNPIPVSPTPVSTLCAAGADTLRSDNFGNGTDDQYFNPDPLTQNPTSGFWQEDLEDGYVVSYSYPTYLSSTQQATPGAPGDATLSYASFAPAALNPTPPPPPPPPPPPGTLVVTKITDPSTDNSTNFPFTVCGGLTPSSFTLQNGQSQTLLGLVPGVAYNVIEGVVAGWILEGVDVSNGTTIDAIQIYCPDDTVTVTFTNKQFTPGTPPTPCANIDTGGQAGSGTSTELPCVTLGAFITALSLRLEDPMFVHWTQAELIRYTNEALRTYNALTQWSRAQASFEAIAGQPFYDLPTMIPNLRAYSVYDQDLLQDLDYALLEPPSANQWIGSEMFTLAGITTALQTKRDQFLRETGAVLTRELQATTIPVSGRVSIPVDVITIRRMAWVTTGGSITPLRRTDEWAMSAFLRSWNMRQIGQTLPTVYSTGVTPPLSVQLAPPVGTGTLDLLSVIRGPALNPTVGELVSIPDDWTWVIKWGALADLLSQSGLASDVPRANYCMARWAQGVKAAQVAAVVLAAQINGSVARLAALQEADDYKRSWQSMGGIPTSVLTAGHNVIALAPMPPTMFNITLDVVRNMPLPVNLNACLMVDSSVEEALLDYCQHLAWFKEGPSQLDASMPLLQRFMRLCGVVTELDEAQVPDRGPIFAQTQQEDRIHARRLPVELPDPIEAPTAK
jgi:hypothetical protein